MKSTNSWLEYDDQVAFAMVNGRICRQLIKHVRVLCLRALWGQKQDFERKFRSYLTSEKLQSLIADPSHQLSLVIPNDLDFKEAGFDDISISCKSLSITADQLTSSLIHHIEKVQNLILGFYYGSTRHSLTESELQLFAERMNNLKIGLKQLTIKNYNITSIPVISSLESLTITNANILSSNRLNISAYSNLRCLKLTSISIEDVSSLDRIHELHLQCCDGIRDISCLNHNYKIVISECLNIQDYSNSFYYSKIINIYYPSNYRRAWINSFDFSKVLEAREFYFHGECNTPLLPPQCSSLRSVQVSSLFSKFTLPSEHHIRDIIVKSCLYLTTLFNFDRIYSVKLVNLYVTTLQGLSSSNCIVEVDTCPLIKDFSMLRHCDKVIIYNCNGFQDVNQLRGVKDLIFAPADVDNLPKDMEGVTCLILNQEPKKLLSLGFPSTLQKLVIKSANVDLIDQLSLLLKRLPQNVGKIEVSIDEKSFRPLLEKGAVSFPEFIVEFKKVIHFLRKLDGLS